MVKLFVGNISPTTDPKEVKKLFEKYGAVSECDVIRNYGFVHMNNEDDARKACDNLNNYVLDGKAIHIEFSTSKLRKAPGMDEVCFRCGEKSHKTTNCPMHDIGDLKFGSKRSSAGDKDSCPPPKRVECYFTPSREIASSGLAYNIFTSGSQSVPRPTASDPDPLIPRPLDRQLEPLYDEYLVARERYYYVRSRLTSGGASVVVNAPPPIMAAPRPPHAAGQVVASFAPPPLAPSFVTPAAAAPSYVAQPQVRPLVDYYAAATAVPPPTAAAVVGRSSPSVARYQDVYYTRTANGYEATTLSRAAAYPATAPATQSNVYFRRNENGTYEAFTLATPAPTYVVQ